MTAISRTTARSGRGTRFYVTVGSLLLIWAGLWYYFFLMPDPNPPAWQRFVCIGAILSGLALAGIGILFATIAKPAETVSVQGPIKPVAEIAVPSPQTVQPAATQAVTAET
jgi:RsiW-degrading membrane proteinase PrsW (M82 family)